MLSVYDKEYVSKKVADRIAELKRRYYMYCQGVDESGRELSDRVSAVARANTRRDMEILALVEELIGFTSDFTLSDVAGAGYEKLVEPMERHRVRR